MAFHDSVVRIGGLIDMLREGGYRDYQKNPYLGVDMG